jgi:epsilon-lactone hydrolase
LDLHGGGLILGGGDLVRRFALKAVTEYGVEVFAPDYRMPPDFPYPTPLDDCVAAYLALLDRHPAKQVIVQGSSAGGNLAAALMLRLREVGAPFPAGLILQSPEIDLTESGDSFQTNLGVDTVLRDSLMPINLLYANGHDLRDPMLSPLFGDFSKGFPPTVITTGTRDLFLSNAVRFHNTLRLAGVPSELIVMEAMPHGAFLGAPEDAELLDDLRAWARRIWREASRS